MKVRVKGGWKIRTESGKLYPKVYPTEAAANERLRQIEAAKHAKKTYRDSGIVGR